MAVNRVKDLPKVNDTLMATRVDEEIIYVICDTMSPKTELILNNDDSKQIYPIEIIIN